MARFHLIGPIIFGLTSLVLGEALALEKVRIGTPSKGLSHYELPMRAALQNDFWKEEGLEAQWTAFAAGGAQARALAAGAIDLITESISSTMITIARGLAVVMIADPKFWEPWFVLVPTPSPLNRAEDLKGKTVGISRLGSLSHSYAQVAAKALGLEGNLKIVAAGGVPERIAAVLAGRLDSIMGAPGTMANLLFGGRLRIVADISPHLPRGDTQNGLVVKRSFVESYPELATKLIKVHMRAFRFVMNNREWSVKELQSCCGYIPQAAQSLVDTMRFSSDLKFDRRSVEEVRDFVIKYGLLREDKAPPVDAIFTNSYIP